MHIASIGADLGKTTFHLVALGSRQGSREEEVFAQTTADLHRQPAELADWHRSLVDNGKNHPKAKQPYPLGFQGYLDAHDRKRASSFRISSRRSFLNRYRAFAAVVGLYVFQYKLAVR
jgi:hypothetical protein